MSDNDELATLDAAIVALAESEPQRGDDYRADYTDLIVALGCLVRLAARRRKLIARLARGETL